MDGVTKRGSMFYMVSRWATTKAQHDRRSARSFAGYSALSFTYIIFL